MEHRDPSRAFEATSSLDARRIARVDGAAPRERTALLALFGCAALLVVVVAAAVRAGDVVPAASRRRAGAVLVTGFSNFDGVENPSMVVARALNGTATRGGHLIAAALLAVSPVGAAATAARLLAGPADAYAAVVHLGLEASTAGLRLEIAGRNIRGAHNNGTCETAPVDPAAPCVLATTAPLGRLALLPGEEWSASAGSFFCNEAYFRTLSAIRHGVRPGRAGLLPAIFIHLPAETTAPVDAYLPRVRELIDVVAGGYAPRLDPATVPLRRK